MCAAKFQQEGDRNRINRRLQNLVLQNADRLTLFKNLNLLGNFPTDQGRKAADTQCSDDPLEDRIHKRLRETFALSCEET